MADVQSRFAAMPPRQKATIGIFILVVIFMIYEVMGLFHTSTPAVPVVPTVTKPLTAKTPAVTPSGSPAPTANSPGGAASANGPPAPPPPPKQAEVPQTINAAPIIQQQEEAQAQYLTALNHLQMLKIQREIAETDQSIAAAKLATVTAEKSIADLLTVKPPEPPAPPQEAFQHETSKMGSGANLPPQIMQPTYVVLSVTMELGQWHAVLSDKGKLINVGVGDTLPGDGSVVSAIDQSGVLLEKSGVQHKLPLMASVQ